MTAALLIGYTSIFLLGLAIVALALAYALRNARKPLANGSFFRIHIPEGMTHSAKEIASTIFQELHKMGVPFALEAAVEALGEKIYLHLITGSHIAPKVKSLIEALGQQVTVADGGNYSLWLSNRVHAKAITLGHNRHTLLPLGRTKEHEHSHFSNFLKVLSDLKPIGEAALLQFIVIPAADSIGKKIHQLYERLSSAEDATELLYKLDKNAIITKETISHLRSKVDTPLFVTHGRFLVATDDKERAEYITNMLQANLKNAPTGSCINGVCNKPAQKNSLPIHDIIQRNVKQKEGMLLNADELSELFHFVPEQHVPKLARR